MSKERLPHWPRCTHRTYHLTCDQHERLLVRAGHRCEVCGTPGGPKGEGLFLDHDHRAGWRAVRGLVCPGCNGLMGSIDRGRRLPSASLSGFMARPWYRELGLDPQCPPDCRYGHHKPPGASMPTSSRRVLAQVRAEVDADAFRRRARWSSAELAWAADRTLTTEDVARRTGRTYASVHMARRVLAKKQTETAA